MTPALTPAGRVLTVALLLGLAQALVQLNLTSLAVGREGPNVTTRLVYGFWFSPWFEQTERVTPVGVETEGGYRVWSVAWPSLTLGAGCLAGLVYLSFRPGRWVRES